MLGAHLRFAAAFLKSPRVVASVVPSSPLLERRIVRAAEIRTARVVVEFGGGTGGTTRALLRALPSDGRLLVIERTEEFIEGLRRIGDPRLTVIHDCASTVGAQLARLGLAGADAIISGIPFSTLPEAVAREIVTALHAALVPGGRFVAYQFTDRVADYVRPVMGEPRIEHEFWNVPPVRVFTWYK
jgi:phosphatidylethanolamine/phosphatidyl-N-methylethanolamine N-methyltransferase